MNPISYVQGKQAEDLFVSIPNVELVRKATLNEDMLEHWDVLVNIKDFGTHKIDVKSKKRKYRHPQDTTTKNEAIWWELQTVRRPDGKNYTGWGVPNGIDRKIALQGNHSFVIVDPSVVYPEIMKNLQNSYGREYWQKCTRGTHNDLITSVPPKWIMQFVEHKLCFADQK